MWKQKRRINKISLTIVSIILLSLVYFSFASANEQTDIEKEYDSMYRYGALENKAYFPTLAISTNIVEEKLPEIDTEIKPVMQDSAEILKDIKEKQNDSIKKSDYAINTIESRSGLRTFLIGNKIGILRFQMVQMEDQSHVLNALALESENETVKNQINTQINASEQQQERVKKIIIEQEGKSSIFGWFLGIL